MEENAKWPVRDVFVPPIVPGEARPGFRVKQKTPKFMGTGLYHILYLPVDYEPGKKYPVIFEYAGNNNRDCLGTMEGAHLDFGLTRGRGFIQVNMPYADSWGAAYCHRWWGNSEVTSEYLRSTVDFVVDTYGGDPDKLVMSGFSRGGAAATFFGLYDDDLARRWKAFFCHDGWECTCPFTVLGAKDEEDCRKTMAERFARLKGRPLLYTHNKPGADETIKSLMSPFQGTEGLETYQLSISSNFPLPNTHFPQSHTDRNFHYLYRDTYFAREWIKSVISR